MAFWEIIGYVLGAFLSTLPVIYILSTKDRWWAQCPTGDMRFVMTGGNLSFIIHDIPGHKITLDNKIEELAPGETSGKTISFTEAWLGAYWIGMYPFRKIHSFSIETTKVNPGGTTPESWITPIKKKWVTSLRHEFPRPFVFTDVEIQSVSSVHALVMCKFKVVDPVIAIFKLKGDFFRTAEDLVSAAFSAIVNDYKSIVEFSLEDREEGGKFSKHFTDPNSRLNQALREQVGLELIGFSVPRIQPTNQEIINAAALDEIARLEGQAKVTKAELESKARGIEAEAEENYLNKTFGTESKILVESLKQTGASEDQIAKALEEVLKSRALSKSTTLHTWVEKGNSATTTISTKP